MDIRVDVFFDVLCVCRLATATKPHSAALRGIAVLARYRRPNAKAGKGAEAVANLSELLLSSLFSFAGLPWPTRPVVGCVSFLPVVSIYLGFVESLT